MVKLASTVHEKVWGSPETEPWYRNPTRRSIGEIWFTTSDPVPLLVKLLFTSANLSVQVHPPGKTEMWHILRAEPEAKVALGLREKVTRERLREASLSGEIMEMLSWIPARRGDTFFVPAGTIHAIGGGLAICEVQQRSDVTYRLYDYGRPRELHLDQAIAVSNLEPVSARTTLPLECAYFRVERITVNGSRSIESSREHTVYIALEGTGSLAREPFQAGDAWEAEAGAGPIEIASRAATFLATYTNS